MSEYDIAVAHPGRGRNPATSNAAFEQLVGIGRVIDEGDRPDCAESVCVKHQEDFRRRLKDDIVSELVLGDDLKQLCWRLSEYSPMHRLFKRPD